LGIDQLI